MKTNFFTELEKLNLKEINISFLFKDNNVTVIILPKSSANDNATKLMPLSLSASIEKMDSDFFNHIKNPLQDVSDFYSNVENFEKEKERKKQNTMKQKEKKENIKKLEIKLKKIVESENFDADKNKSNVISICKELSILDIKNKLAEEWNKKINELTTKTLFD